MHFYAAAAILICGALTSIISGYIGMYIATRTNVRVTYLAATFDIQEVKLQKCF